MAKVWPKTDDFDQGAIYGFGSSVRGYYGAVPTTADFQPGKAHDGYGGAAASRIVVPNSTPGNAIGLVRRQEFPEDVVVAMQARKEAVSGVARDTYMQRHGVIARAQVATSVPSFGAGASRWVWFEEVSCYAFEARQVGASQFRLMLLRYAAGFETVLAQTDILSGNVPEWASTHSLSLDVSTNGGDVDLVGRVGGVDIDSLLGGDAGETVFGTMGGSGEGGGPFTQGDSAGQGGTLAIGDRTVTGPIGATGVKSKKRVGPIPSLIGGGSDEADMLVHTDSSGSKLTGGGRCGFILDDEAIYGSDQVVSVCDVFQVSTQAAGTVLWRDEWERAAPSLSAQYTDALGTVGRDVTSDYSSDQGGVEPTFLLTGDILGDAVTQGGKIDLGTAPDLPGTGAQVNGVSLNNPFEVFPPPNLPSATKVTIAVWAKIDSNRNGNEFYQAGNVDESDTFAYGWRDAGGGLAQIEVRLGNGVAGAPSSYLSTTFSAAVGIGQSFCYIVTYAARVDASQNGRLRIYIGRLGQAALLDELVVSPSDEPGFSLQGVASTEAHRIGERRTNPVPGSNADRYLDGTVDQVSVFYSELSIAALSRVCDETVSKGELQALGIVHGLDFENVTTGASFHIWDPWTATVVPGNSARWLLPNGIPLVDGLVSQVDTSVFEVIHQRPPESDHEHSRGVTITLPTEGSRAGLALRYTGDADVGTYYRILVGVGSPAPVSIERVIAGVGTVIAKQSDASVAAVASTTPFDLVASVRRLDVADPSSSPLFVVSIDGVAIPVTVSSAVGAALDAGGSLLDNSSQRILAGAASGMLVVTAQASNVELDDFEVVNPPDAPGPGNAPLAYLPGAADRKFGSLNDAMTPDWDVELTSDPDHSVRGRFHDGRPFKRALTTYSGRRFRLRSVSSLPAETVAMRDFVDEHGAEFPFTFDPSGFFPMQDAGTFVLAESSFQDGLSGKAGVYVFTIVEIPDV